MESGARIQGYSGIKYRVLCLDSMPYAPCSMLFRYAPCAFRRAILLFLIHLDSVVLLFASA